MSKSKSGKPPTIRDEVAQLRIAIENLAQHVEVLRIAIDDARDEFAWAARNHRVWSQSPPSMILGGEPIEMSEPVALNDPPVTDELPTVTAGKQPSLFE